MFGPVYARAYDFLYKDKRYAAECSLLERLFRLYAVGEVRSIVDLGCGTGGHAVPLARRGYDVTGVDRSASMLACARAKASGRVALRRADIRKLDLDRRFDAALMLFGVLGYQADEADALSALAAARRHLRAGGIFIFDAWHGEAVLRLGPSDRLKVVPAPWGRIMRAAEARIDAPRHVCVVRYRLETIEDGRIAQKTAETHRVRFFFKKELAGLLRRSGLRLLRWGAFPEFARGPAQTDWNIMGVARAV